MKAQGKAIFLTQLYTQKLMSGIITLKTNNQANYIHCGTSETWSTN
jgi:hypothetical protein